MKVFLSHSSSDKEHFAKKIADKLGSFVIYDEYTFEGGMKTIDEIKHNIVDNTNLFVILLSDNALNSQWVKDELSLAYAELGNNISRIYPIIIDNKIDHTDDRIPKWLSSEYNIRRVLSIGKIISHIKRRLREIKWEKNVLLEKHDNLFIGRNDQTKQLEERLYDIDQPIPRVVFAQGLPKIGKKSFFKYMISKTQSQYKKSYVFPTIYLDSTNSIEDFILFIDDLDFTVHRVKRDNITSYNKKEKIELAVKLLVELNESKELLLIEDFGAILAHNGEMVVWFKELIDKLKYEKEEIYLLVASKFSSFRFYTDIESYYYKTKIDELSPTERMGLLTEYIKIYDLSDKVNRENLKDFSQLLKGYPEQVKYLALRIKETSCREVMMDSHDIVAYNEDKIYSIIEKYPIKSKEFELLLLLSHIDMISYELLESIIEEKDKNFFFGILNQFFIESICERYGAQNEYFRVNDVIKDHIVRLQHKIPKRFIFKLNENLNKFIEENKFDDANLSDFFYYINQALIQGKEIPEKYLLPSHFLKTIANLYNKQKHDLVIKIANRILKKVDYIDDFIVFEMRFYLCSSYAKRRDKRFFDEVNKIDKIEERNFLKGFYYRLAGQFNKSIDFYKKAIDKRTSFSRARRELVQVYLNVYEFEKAFPVAKQNYKKWSNNVYHIHAYCMIILSMGKDESYTGILKELIDKLELSCYNDRAKQMYQECKSLYYAYYLNDLDGALDIINQSITEFPTSVYPLLSKFDILEYFDKIKLLDEIFQKITEKTTYDKKLNIITTGKIVRSIVYKIKKDRMGEARSELRQLIESTGYNFEYIKKKYNLSL